MQTKLFSSLALAFIYLIVGCTSKPTPVAQIQKLGVVQVMQQTIPVERDFVGQVFGQSDITIRARVDGFVEGLHFQEGSMVTKGQLLYTIDELPYQTEVARLQSMVSEAKIKAVNANNELERLQPLVASSAISKSDYDAAVATKGSADENVKAAQSALEMARINLGYCRITSPISGLIGKSQAKVGEYVGRFPNPVILNTVSATDSIVVEFFINERDFMQLAKAYRQTSAEEREKNKDAKPFQLILSDGSIFTYPGKLNFVDRGVNPGTASILVQATFPNPDRVIRPGQFARVRATMDMLDNALLVPQRCVIEVQGNFFVFTVDEKGVLNKQSIDVRSRHRDFYIVNSGVKSGDQILLDGLLRAQSGMPIEAQLVQFESNVKD